MLYSLVILDRDGVINFDSVDYIKSPEEWRPIPGSLEAIAALNQARCRVVIATNQSGIGRGYYTVAVLASIHQKMQDALKKVGGHIDHIYYCPHLPEQACMCRKPNPGMIWQIKNDFPELFDTAVLVGDSWRDLQAARAGGCRAVLVKTGLRDYEQCLKNPEFIAFDQLSVYADLATFVRSRLT